MTPFTHQTTSGQAVAATSTALYLPVTNAKYSLIASSTAVIEHLVVSTTTATSTSLTSGFQLLRLQTGTIEATSTTGTSTFSHGVSFTAIGTSATSSFAGIQVLSGGLKVPSLAGCSQALETNSAGDIICGTDQTGSGGAVEQSKWATTTDNLGIYVNGVTNPVVGIGTTTPRWALNIASSTAPQLALSDGSSTSGAWTFRNINGNLYLATSSPTTFATTSIPALSIAANGYGTTTLRALEIVGGQGTTTSNVGMNITGGCYAKNGVCINGADSQFTSVDNGTTTNAGITVSTASTSAGVLTITPRLATSDVYLTGSYTVGTIQSGTANTRMFSSIVTGSLCTAGTELASGVSTTTSTVAINGTSMTITGLHSNPGASAQNYSFCLRNETVGASVSFYFSALVISSGADYAELYTTNDQELQPGDVVAADDVLYTGVRKTNGRTDSPVMGVVSTDPGSVIGGNVTGGKKIVPIALNGRVPVKINLEGGSITTGDKIALSSVAGVAKKAERFDNVIGIALQPFDETSVGNSITVYLQLHNQEDLRALAEKFASTTATTTDEAVLAGVFADASVNLKSAFSTAWETLGDLVSYGIREFGIAIKATIGVFEKVFAKEVHTDKLCVEDVCVTKEEFLNIVQSANGRGSVVTQVSPDSTTEEPPPPENDVQVSETESPAEDAPEVESGEPLDTDDPVITVHGNDPAEIEVGSTYNDLGISVTDNVQTNIGAKASVDGGEEVELYSIYIDTSVAGTHTITYRAVDTAGNVGEATRTVSVVANNPPVADVEETPVTVQNETPAPEEPPAETPPEAPTAVLEILTP